MRQCASKKPVFGGKLAVIVIRQTACLGSGSTHLRQQVRIMRATPIVAALFLVTIMSSTSYAQKIVIAHRGASGYLPEHTLEAKAMAYAQGAHYICLLYTSDAADE